MQLVRLQPLKLSGTNAAFATFTCATDSSRDTPVVTMAANELSKCCYDPVGHRGPVHTPVVAFVFFMKFR